MPDYTPNSYKYRNEQKNASEGEEKRPAKVTTGAVKTRKKKEKRALRDIVTKEDAMAIGERLLFSVCIPFGKRFLSESLNVILYPDGDPDRRKKRVGDRVSYEGCYDSGSSRRRGSEREYRRRNVFDFDEIVFESRGDAEVVLEGMEDILDEYQFVGVDAFYDLAGVTITNYMASKYGWYNLSNARIIRLRDEDGYIIDFPKAVPRR